MELFSVGVLVAASVIVTALCAWDIRADHTDRPVCDERAVGNDAVRMMITGVNAVALLMWPVLLWALQPTLTPMTLIPALYTMVLIGVDALASQRSTDYNSASMQEHAAEARNSGTWIVSCIISAGIVMARINGAHSGHTHKSAEIMMVAIIIVVASMLPTAWDTTAMSMVRVFSVGVRRVALHYAIGLFLISTAQSWMS